MLINESNPIRCRLQSEGWRLWTSILFCSGLPHCMQSHSFLSTPLCCHTRHCADVLGIFFPYNPFQSTFRMFWCLLTWPKYLSFLDLMSFIRDLVTFRWLRTYWFVLFSVHAMEYGPGVCRSTSRMQPAFSYHSSTMSMFQSSIREMKTHNINEYDR